MRSFFWKIAICLLPCIAAGWVTAHAVEQFRRGESGGFKLGPDLAGGTILVYEIDVRKTKSAHDQEAKSLGKKDDKDARADARETAAETQADIVVLAEALKRRIDPNDLKNIIIRPSGGEGRVEIVLPTGGTHRARIAAEKWNKLLDEVSQWVEKEFHVDKKFEVGRGRELELAEKIQQAVAEEIWQKKLFNQPGAWKRLTDNALVFWPILYNNEPVRKEIQAIAVDQSKMGHLDLLENYLIKTLDKVGEPTTDKAVQAWFKQQAWEEMMYRATEKWPDLALTKDERTRLQELYPEKTIRIRPEMEAIVPDNTEQLTTYIQSKGNIVAQGSLTLLEGVVGTDVYGTFPAAEVDAFIRENYGPSVQTIVKKIRSYSTESGYGKDLSVEEVQRIKDLVAKVGRLRVPHSGEQQRRQGRDRRRQAHDQRRSQDRPEPGKGAQGGPGEGPGAAGPARRGRQKGVQHHAGA